MKHQYIVETNVETIHLLQGILSAHVPEEIKVISRITKDLEENDKPIKVNVDAQQIYIKNEIDRFIAYARERANLGEYGPWLMSTKNFVFDKWYLNKLEKFGIETEYISCDGTTTYFSMELKDD